MGLQFSISLKRLFRLLFITVGILMIINLIVVVTDYMTINSELLTVLQQDLKLLFDFNLEANIPTFYSTIMLFSCATVLAIIALIRKQNKERFANHWGFLSIIFYLLSLDEASQIHEKLGTILRVIFNHANTRPLWVVAGLIIVGVMSYQFKDFVFHLPIRARWFFMIAGILFVMGSIGIDTFGSWFILKNYGREHIFYRINVFIEETCELNGITTFFYILLWYIREIIGSFNLGLAFSEQKMPVTGSENIPAAPNPALAHSGGMVTKISETE